MISFEVPFFPESFLNHKRYREARTKHLNDDYVGRHARFTGDIIYLSGRIVHEQGKEVIINKIDDCDYIKLETLNGELIDGVFTNKCLELIDMDAKEAIQRFAKRAGLSYDEALKKLEEFGKKIENGEV